MNLEVILAKIIAKASMEIIFAKRPFLKTAVTEGIDRSAEAITKRVEGELSTILGDLLRAPYYDENREYYNANQELK